MKIQMTLAVLAAMAASGTALGAGASFTGTFNGIVPPTPITWSVTGGAFNNAGAAGFFNWTKTGGTYSGVSGNFDAFCLELTETIQEPNSYTYKVVPLASGVAPDGDGMFTFPLDATQIAQMSELWGRHRSSITAATATAFQLAIWEIVYDNNLIINGLGDSLQFTAPTPAGDIALAQFYLNSIDGTGPMMTLEAFTHPTQQDQIIPAPGTIALLGVGGLLAARRRRSV